MEESRFSTQNLGLWLGCAMLLVGVAFTGVLLYFVVEIYTNEGAFTFLDFITSRVATSGEIGIKATSIGENANGFNLTISPAFSVLLSLLFCIGLLSTAAGVITTLVGAGTKIVARALELEAKQFSSKAKSE